MIRNSLMLAIRGLSLALPVAMSLGACASEGPSVDQTNASEASQYLDYGQTKDGQTVARVKPGQLDAYVKYMAENSPESSQVSYSTEGQSSGEPQGATDGSQSDQIEKSYCWVTLDYCTPMTCHDNGGCTWTQFINACFSLYDEYC